jgi:YHS domain-containing protein
MGIVYHQVVLRAYWIPEYIRCDFTSLRNAEVPTDFRKAEGISPWKADSRTKMRLMAVDPICRMEVDEKTAKWKSSYAGKEYSFCAPGCKKTFDKNPAKYV